MAPSTRHQTCWTMLTVLLVSFLPLLCQASRDDLFDFKVNELGVTTSLWCNASVQYETAPNDSVPVSWMLPNLTVLAVSVDRYRINDGNLSLEVTNVTRDDLGQYHCMLRYPWSNDSKSWYLARVGLNAEGPYFEDLWAKYELNTIIAISAGFGFLFSAIAILLIYHYRWIEESDDSSNEGGKENGTVGQYKAYGDDDDVEKKNSTSGSIEMGSYSNKGYNDGGDLQESEDGKGVNDEKETENATSL